MRHFKADELRHRTVDPSDLRDTAGAIERNMAGFARDGYPRVVEVGQPEDPEPLEWVFSIELAPGLTMLSEFAEEEFEGFLATRGDDFARYAASSAAEAWRMADELRAQVRRATRAARALFADAQERGVPARLLRVAIGDRGNWDVPETVMLVVEVEGLSDTLRPMRTRMVIRHGTAPEAVIAGFLEDQTALAAARVRLGRMGVDGEIDALTLGALRREGSFRQVVDRLRVEDRVTLRSGLQVFWNEGRISSEQPFMGGRLAWDGDTVTVTEAALPRR